MQALLDRTGDQPPVIKYIVERLEALGYLSWAHRVLNSAAFGVPNRRRRVFLIASLHGDARDVLLSRVGKQWWIEVLLSWPLLLTEPGTSKSMLNLQDAGNGCQASEMLACQPASSFLLCTSPSLNCWHCRVRMQGQGVTLLPPRPLGKLPESPLCYAAG